MYCAYVQAAARKILSPESALRDDGGPRCLGRRKLACALPRHNTQYTHTHGQGATTNDSKQQAAAARQRERLKPTSPFCVFFFPFSAPARREIRSGAPNSPPARAPLANRMAGVIYRSNTASNPCSGPHPFLPPPSGTGTRPGPVNTHVAFFQPCKRIHWGPAREGRGPTRGVGTRPVGRPFWCAPLGNSQGQGGEGGRKGRVERATVVQRVLGLNACVRVRWQIRGGGGAHCVCCQRWVSTYDD